MEAGAISAWNWHAYCNKIIVGNRLAKLLSHELLFPSESLCMGLPSNAFLNLIFKSVKITKRDLK